MPEQTQNEKPARRAPRLLPEESPRRSWSIRQPSLFGQADSLRPRCQPCLLGQAISLGLGFLPLAQFALRGRFAISALVVIVGILVFPFDANPAPATLNHLVPRRKVRHRTNSLSYNGLLQQKPLTKIINSKHKKVNQKPPKMKGGFYRTC